MQNDYEGGERGGDLSSVISSVPISSPVPAPTGAAVLRAIIHFTVYKTKLDLFHPWKTGSPTSSTGTGFYIGNRRIITNSHVVQSSTSIRLERNGSPGTFKGRVLCESVLCDLALVTVDSESFWKGLPEITLQEEVPNLGDTVIVLGYPKGNKSVTMTRGIVSNVTIKDLSLKNRYPRLLCVQIDAAINPGNSGGPVLNLNTNQVIGVAFSHLTKAQCMSYIIPVDVLNMFLSAFDKDGRSNFGLLPEIGFNAVETVNNAQRRFALQQAYSEDSPVGCLVGCVQSFSPASGFIEVDDVIVEVEGRSVSEKGEVLFRKDEWLPFDWLISKKSFGELLTIKLLRKEVSGSLSASERRSSAVKELVVQVPVVNTSHLVPRLLFVDFVPYWVIVGGLVFIRLSLPLLWYCEKHDHDYASYLSALISNSVKEFEGEEVVLCGDVLSHFVNTSYHKYKWYRLTKINRIPIKNLAHLAELVNLLCRGTETETSASTGLSSSESIEVQPDLPTPTTDDSNDSDDSNVALDERTAPSWAKRKAEDETEETTAVTLTHGSSISLSNVSISADAEAVDTHPAFIELDFKTTDKLQERRFAVFDVSELIETEREILATHKVPNWCSPELEIRKAST